jgi:poly(beta-D-mannuronate) lyase
MKSLKTKILLFNLFYCLFSITAANKPTNILVTNAVELNAAIESAKAGQTIVMKAGEWKNIQIDFHSAATAALPVTLCAQIPGKVIICGNSSLTFSKSYLVVDGLVFKNGSCTDNNSVISYKADYCRLTNTVINNYNPASFDSGYYWVYFESNHNRVDHCLFTGKNNMNPVLGNDNENARYNKVDSCFIKDIPYVPKANGREIFRIWGYGHADETGDDGAYFTVEYNLFDHADGEGTEIISLKSNYNTVRYNTVIASRGGLVGRRGKFNTFDSNIILGKGQSGTTGIRVAGSNHKVINNYISDVTEDGLRLIAGEYYEKSLTTSFAPKKKSLPKYLQVQNGYFAQNSIVNCGGNGIDIGFSYKNDWPSLQMVLLPESNRFVNNIIYNCKGNSIVQVAQDKSKPLDFFQFSTNLFEKNIAWGSKVAITPMPVGITVQRPKYAVGKDGIYHFDMIKSTDLKPLTAREVGPKWLMK